MLTFLIQAIIRTLIIGFTSILGNLFTNATRTASNELVADTLMEARLRAA